jgi:hypothetical protein
MNTVADRTAAGWNPRYLAYCIDKGERSPADMIRRDRALWPGGHMTGFVLWIHQRWDEWRELSRYPKHAALGPEQHAHFDSWLADRMIELTWDSRGGEECQDSEFAKVESTRSNGPAQTSPTSNRSFGRTER